MVPPDLLGLPQGLQNDILDTIEAIPVQPKSAPAYIGTSCDDRNVTKYDVYNVTRASISAY
jgi:hypothetical protein